ncbi:MAG: ATP-binding cassette domain-containing protein [Bacilli bacterium]|nr:ATP-binding cassette domain-containing protein [Bacilli bacterium]
MIQLKYINKRIQSHVIFENLNLTLPATGLFLLVGENGCGKSTLLYILSGLDTAYSGEYLFDERKIKSCSEKELDALRRNEIGVLFSHGNLFEFMDVKGNRNFDLNSNDCNLIALPEKEPVSYLSGGEELLLAMENEFAKNKKVYLLDEVTSALDEQNLKTVMDMLVEQSKKSLILIATHDKRIINSGENILITANTSYHITQQSI